jgi:S1-C subfamily serine protease
MRRSGPARAVRLASRLERAAAACGLLACAPLSAGSEPTAPGDAMAFIRVVADVTVDYHDARQPVVRKNVALATGSGFVIAPSGLVLTSLHVVEVEPKPREDGPELTLDNERVQVFVGAGGGTGAWEAHVVAKDPEHDLAALQMTAAELPYLPLGDSDAVETGRPVQVLGFPFGRLAEVAKRDEADLVPQVSVTAGSLSATRADDAGETRYLQTDASVQPGNSGGPMLDEQGYVVGVVRMKLARDATASGAGFAVPVEDVKDFLEANGLLDRLPVARLRAGVRNLLEWKQVAVDLPEGFSDRSTARVSADAGEVGDIAFRVDRWETPWPAAGLEEALLGGEAVPAFVPSPATPLPRPGRKSQPPVSLAAGRSARLLGSGLGTDRSGRRFRVEYAIVDLGREKVAARYLGPADAVAFNLGVLRRSLASLEAGPLLASSASAWPPSSPLAWAAFPNGDGGALVPRDGSREPATRAACAALPAADAGVLVRNPADFTLVLRALRWASDATGLEPALAECGAAPVPAALQARGGYAFQFERLGVPVAVRGLLMSRGGSSLVLELETPLAKLVQVDALYARWVQQVAAATRPPG